VGILGFTRSERWQRALRRFYRIGSASLRCGDRDLLFFRCFGSDQIAGESRQRPAEEFVGCVFYKVPREKNYSAPFAKTTYAANRAKPLEGRHVLGTDQLGKDVLQQTMKGCSTAI